MTFARPHDLCHMCTYADEHSTWPQADPHHPLTHCRACHGSWSMRSEFQHCVGCHRTFTNWRAADAHRGPDGCRDPATVRDGKGLNRLALSTKTLQPGSTVQLWAMADHRTEAPERTGV